MTRGSPSGEEGRGAVRLAVIDAFRGLAALGVMLFHFGGFFRWARVPGGLSAVGTTVVATTRWGWVGVQVFFVISGFVIALARPRPAVGPPIAARFLLRRLVRLAPPYLFSVACCLGIYGLSQTIGHGEMPPISLAQCLAHVVFLQDLLGFRSLQDVYWTICLEVQFYAFFVVLLLVDGAVNPRRRWLPTAVLHLVPFLVSLGVVLGGPGLFVAHWYAFALGAMICLAGERVLPVGFVAGCWSGLAAVVALRPSVAEAVVLGTSLAFFILFQTGLANVPSRFVDRLASLGRISYSLYLTHALIGGLFFARLRGHLVGSESRLLIFIGFASLVSIAMAALMYELVEKPAIRWSHRFRVKRAAGIPQPAPGPASPWIPMAGVPVGGTD